MLKKFTFVFLLASINVWAVDFKTPWLSGPVIDELQVIRPVHKNEIEQMVRAFNEKGIAQLQVFVTESLQGLPIEKASIDIVDHWKLGDAKKDNGLLFLIAPNERKVRIEVGQGLEGVLPDIYAKRINEDIVLPYFKKGQMSEGVYNGVKAILAIVGEQNVDQLQKLAPAQASSRKGVKIPMWAIILIWLFIFFIGRGGGSRRRLHRGAWIGGSSGWGGGGFGGGGGGGWSGGGGGFSGGGSSSSW